MPSVQKPRSLQWLIRLYPILLHYILLTHFLSLSPSIPPLQLLTFLAVLEYAKKPLALPGVTSSGCLHCSVSHHLQPLSMSPSQRDLSWPPSKYCTCLSFIFLLCFSFLFLFFLVVTIIKTAVYFTYLLYSVLFCLYPQLECEIHEDRICACFVCCSFSKV